MADSSIQSSLSNIPSVSLSSNRKHFVENCIVVWLDLEISEQYVEILHNIVNDVHTFTNFDASIDFMSDIIYEKIFFITSKTLGVEIMPILNDFTQIYGIYIFNSTNKEQDNWSQNYRKVKSNFTDITSLRDRIKDDMTQCEREILSFHVLQTKSSLTNTNSLLNMFNLQKLPNQQDAIFMYSTLTKEIICMMEDDDLHENMIDFCHSEYANNRHVLKMIDEFDRNYDSYSPISWYTRDGFLYKMLNKALRTNDIKPLFLFHNYIRHLHQQLVELRHQSVRSEPLILYRGQQIPTVDFENIKNNIGGLLSISNFLSTTATIEVAEIFAGHSFDDPTVSCVLFQLNIDPTANTFPFANIEQHSFFEGAEKEYLFSMGSVFRIEKVQQKDDQVWLVQLILTNDNDPMLAELKENLRSSILDENPVLMFGGLLIRMGEYEKAEYFYQIGLTMENQLPRLATVWNQLGFIFDHLDRIDEAHSCYQESLQANRQYLDKNDPQLAIIYNNIGTVYQRQGNMESALKYFRHALSLHLLAPESNQEYIATEYNNIAAILIEQGDLEEAVVCLQRTLDIKLKVLPSNHPNLAHAYYSLAMSYYALDRYDEMFDYMQKALTIDKQSLPENHPQTQFHEENMKAALKRMLERIATGSIIVDDN